MYTLALLLSFASLYHIAAVSWLPVIECTLNMDQAAKITGIYAHQSFRPYQVKGGDLSVFKRSSELKTSEVCFQDCALCQHFFVYLACMHLPSFHFVRHSTPSVVCLNIEGSVCVQRCRARIRLYLTRSVTIKDKTLDSLGMLFGLLEMTGIPHKNCCWCAHKLPCCLLSE